MDCRQGLAPCLNWLRLQENIWPVVSDRVAIVIRQKGAADGAQGFPCASSSFPITRYLHSRRLLFAHSGVVHKLAPLLEKNTTLLSAQQNHCQVFKASSCNCFCFGFPRSFELFQLVCDASGLGLGQNPPDWLASLPPSPLPSAVDPFSARTRPNKLITCSQAVLQCTAKLYCSVA